MCKICVSYPHSKGIPKVKGGTGQELLYFILVLVTSKSRFLWQAISATASRFILVSG